MSASTPQPLLVLGTSLFVSEVADLATEAGFEVTGFVENLDREKCGTELDGRPVRWIDDCDSLVATHLAVCGLGTTRRSVFTDQAAALGLRFATVIHPSAHVSRTSTIGGGCIARSMEREIATPATTRELLGLARRPAATARDA